MGYLDLQDQLSIFQRLPEGILALEARDLHRILSGPTLIHLKGEREPAAFVSVLLHGNEHTSWEALRALLKEYEARTLPRSLSIFIGNVEAAKHNLRRMDDGHDFNRIWGSKNAEAHPIMQKVLDELRERKIFLSLDIHNNTGKNPHYACINNLEPNFLYLASLFSKDVVYFLKPEGVQSLALAELCPAVTLECGLSGESSGAQHALEFLKASLHIAEFPEKPIAKENLRVYHTVAIVKINPEHSFTYSQEPNKSDYEIVLDTNLEETNFTELRAGSVLGVVNKNVTRPFNILAEDGSDVSQDFIEVIDGSICLKRKVIPAMFTLNKDVIAKDCLCYFMEYYPLS